MKNTMTISALVVGLLMPGLVLANGSPKTKAMMTQSGCFACHAVTYKIVGPAYGWVAYVFAHKPGAEVKLAHKVITGGTGRWAPWTGAIPMVPHPQLSLAQAEGMVAWVLAQKPIAPPKP